MSRNVDSIRSAFSRVQGTQSTSETLNFPPGHFVGFFLSFDGGQIVVSEGEANVAGHSVRLANSATLEENAWAVTRSAQHMYYVYLKRDGNFWVDTNDPTWMSMYNGFYHPVLAYRYLGKVFVDSDGKLIYKLSAHYDQQSAIVVGAKGYTGYMDYECDGVDDQEEINLALKFANEWGEYGGKVRLSRGGFYTTAAIDVPSNVSLEGDGMGATVITKNCNDYGIKVVGTSVIYKSNVSISLLTVTRDAADTNDKALIRVAFASNVAVEKCSAENSYRSGIETYDSCTNIRISDNLVSNTIWRGISCYANTGRVSGNIVNNSGNYGIYIECNEVDVENNNVSDCLHGIYVAGDGNNIRSNTIRTIDGYGVAVVLSDDNTISGNTISNVAKEIQTTVAISIDSAVSEDTYVASNHCYDNGNLIDRGNCESATPPAMIGEVTNTTSNATFARSSDYADTGTYSYKYTKTVAAGTNSYVMLQDNELTTDLHGAIAGQKHTLTVRVYIPSGGALGSECLIGLRHYVGAAWVGATQAAANVYDQWQTVTLTVTADASATGFGVYLDLAAAAENGEVFYVDNIRLRPDGVGNDYSQQFADAGTGTLTNGNTWEI